MKLYFENDINDFQDARRLKMILDHYSHSSLVDKNSLLLIETLLDQIKTFLANPAFKRFNQSFEISAPELLRETPGVTLFNRVISYWRSLTGPTSRELTLSNQRHELIERAERAEAIAFEAIAETTEIGRQRDAVLKKLQELEKTR